MMSRIEGGEVGVVREKLGGFVQHAFFLLVQRNDVVHTLDILSKVSLVQLFV